MTTEDEFQAMLDENPGDWQTRLVFADWLQERGDPRAEGYRALGVHRRAPDMTWRVRYVRTDRMNWFEESDTSVLPSDWWHSGGASCEARRTELLDASRRAAEDVAALAFAKLPADRRAELLTMQPV